MQKTRKVNLIFSLVMIVLTGCNLTSAIQQTGTPAAPDQLVLDTQTSPALPDQGSPTLTPPSTPGIASLGSASAADLARQILQPDSSLNQSFEAVQEALARGGVATMDVNGVYVAAYQPASPMPETHANILAMTLEVRNHAHRATLEELAQMLKDLGWPFSPNSTPGEQLASLMAAWIGAALDNPSDPQSFTPLFMAEMAQRQVLPVDLSSGSADPTRVRLGMLEIVLFSAAFDRNMVVPQSSIPPEQKEARSPGLTMVRFTLPNQEEGPCTRFKRFFYGDLSSAILPDPLGKQLGDFVFSYTFGDVLSKAVESRGWDAETFGKAMAAMNVLGRISKLVELYSSLSVSVAVQGENPVHKPLDVESEKEVIFDAMVGVSEEDWSDYQQKNGELGMTIDRIGRDCMSVLGLPTIANTGDIAQAVQGFKVEWSIVSGSPEHGYDAREDEQDQGCGYHQMRLRCSVAPVSDHSGKSSFMIVVIQNKPPETQAVHESGDLVSSKIEVCAQVDASEPPNLSTFINGAMGGVGLADPVAELLSGMILKLGKPEACAEPPLEVTWHVQRSYQASGTFGEMTFFGVICSLEQPFEVEANSPHFTYTYYLTPSSAQGGSWTASGMWDDPNGNVGAIDGSGSYTVNAVDGIANELSIAGTYTTHTTIRDVGGTWTNNNVILTPLETNECRQP